MPFVAAAYFLIEVFSFILLGQWIGYGWAALVILGTFLLGMAVSAWQLRALAYRVATQTEHPGTLTADAALSVLGAVLVAVPGVVSSFIGLLFLLPPTRYLIRRGLGAGARAALTRFGGSAFLTVTHYGAPGASTIPGWGEVIDHRESDSPRDIRE